MPEPTLEEMVKGCRVEVHPGTDLWMMGARYGTVVGVAKIRGKEMLRVQMDRVSQGRPKLLAWGDIGRWLSQPGGCDYGDAMGIGEGW